MPAAYDNRIRVTDLDSYAYYRRSDMDLDSYVTQLKGLTPPGVRAEIGTAFHQALELEHPQQLEAVFDLSHIDVSLPRPEMRERMIERLFTIPSGRRVRVRGRVDAVLHDTVIDYKTTARINAETYMASLQWRTYLAMYPASRFRYEVFEVGREPYGMRYPVWDHASFTCRPYDAMYDDVLDAIAEYDGFLMRLADAGHIELTSEGVRRELAEWRVAEGAREAWTRYMHLPEEDRADEGITNPKLQEVEIGQSHVRMAIKGEPGSAPLCIATMHAELSRRWPGYTVYLGMLP